MKNLIIILLLMLIHLITFAQSVAINETGLPAEPTSLLDISSTTKGLLIPRMRTIERVAIVSPAEGLFVYDIDTHTFWYSTNSIWKEILKTGDGGFTLPYDGVGTDPNKLFSITNTSAATNTTIYGRRLGGSGLGLGLSNAIWGDNLDGNGVAGTSDSNSGVAGFSNTGIGTSGVSLSGPGLYANSVTGFGISCISQLNFGLASTSNGVDKPGVLGVNGNNTGAGYGVIGLIENTTGGAGVWGKNNSIGGNGGLFTIGNINNPDHALKATTSGSGAAGYFSSTGLGPSGYFVHNNTSNTNPGLIVSNTSNGPGLAVWNGAANTNHGIWVAHNGSGKAIYSTSQSGRAGVFEILSAGNSNATLEASTIGTGIAGKFSATNPINDDTAIKASTLGTGFAGTFIKDNTSGSTSDIRNPCVLIENNSKGAALKINSMHSPSANSGIDLHYGGDAFGANIISAKGGVHSVSTGATSSAIIAENYAGGYAMKAYANSSSQGAIHAENSNMFGRGVKAVVTGSQAMAFEGIANSATAAISGTNTGGSGVGVRGLTDGEVGDIGYAIRGETGLDSWGIAGQFISNCPDALTNTLWVIDNSKGQSFRIQVNNDQNDNEALYVRHDGTGKLISLNSANNEEFSVLNNGNTMIDGTLLVKGNKGIVRSSSGTQMRIETLTSPAIASGNLVVGGSVSVNVNFGTAFSSAPTVSVANINSGFSGACDSLTPIIKDVTTTGCTIKVINTYMANSGAFSGTWKIMVIGAE